MDEVAVKKIIVKPDHELTDIADMIRRSEAENILISFPEPSDLLVTPIGIEVLQEIADEQERSVIFQILDNPAGVRNVSEAGAVYIDTTDEIPQDLWEVTYTNMKNRKRELTDALKRTSTALSHKDNGLSPDEVGQLDSDEIERIADGVEEALGSNEPIHIEEVGEKSEFQQRIDRVLERSKADIESGKGKTVSHGGLAIALDHDISEEEVQELSDRSGEPHGPAIEDNSMFNSGGSDRSAKGPKTEKFDLTGRDMLQRKSSQTTKSEPIPITGFPRGSRKGRSNIDNSSTVGAGLKSISGKLSKIVKKVGGSKRSKKFALILLLPIVLLTAGSAYAYYTFTPLAKVNIFIESRPVAAEKTFSGSPDVITFDFETGQVPVKLETLKKERSDSTTATGQAERGEKATGMVRFLCGPIDGEFDVQKTIPGGTSLTSGDGLVFVLVSDVSFSCPSTDFPTGTAEAAEFGAEYNISSGNTLVVAGEPDVAATTETSFTGGLKEEYTVISQADFDRAVNPLKESAFNEAESELSRMEEDGWVLVQNSVKSELDGQVLTDLPIGVEAEILNVTVKTISTALFYKRGDIEAVAEQMLLEAAQEENLFETENEIELQLSDEINTEVNVTSIDGDRITIVMTVSGAVKPEVDKAEILSNLEGKKLDEGARYLEGLTFVAQKTELSFTPESFPEGLRYFPSRQGRIILNIKDVEPEEVVEEVTEE